MEKTTSAYKEWEGVCEALARGKQHVLLRKGGIHEGRRGFSFKHERFYLFPTRFHAQGEQVRELFGDACRGGMDEWKAGDEIVIRWWCQAMWARTLSDWKDVASLEPFHIWKEDLVRERFDCGEVQRIHCALVRVFALPEPLKLTFEKRYGGCRTWVGLPFDSPDEVVAVVPDDDFTEVQARVENIFQR